MRKRVNLINRVSALGLSFFLALGLNAPAFTFEAKAEALPEILNNSTTIADIVMSYCASSGCAIMNEDFINNLYNGLGNNFGTIQDFVNNGLLYLDTNGQLVTEGLQQSIEAASVYTELGLDNIFNISAEEAAAVGGVASSGAATLAGSVAGIASTGVLPLFIGVTGAYWGGIALGTLFNHLQEMYGRSVFNGSRITEAEYLNSLPEGYSASFFYDYDGALVARKGECTFYGITYPVSWSNDHQGFILVAYNPNKLNQTIAIIETNLNNGNQSNKNVTSNNLGFGANSFSIRKKATSPVIQACNTYSEAEAYRNSLISGDIDPPSYNSPDLIGSNGNLIADPDEENGGYTIPNTLPQIDPSTQSVNPTGLTLEDWLRFANDAKGNYTDGNPNLNADLMADIIGALRGNTPTPNPNPNPDPSPDGETYPIPGPVPDNTPVPDPEYQPETRPQPEYTEKATENETDITEGDPWTTPDLLDKFPFCIPRDVYRVFNKLDSGARSAPHIQWRFNPNNMIDYTFDIDFAEWDTIATLLRSLELLGFIVALALATRKMIMS